MQQELAQRLLSATLNWSDEEIEEYRELLDDFSELKYDQYQQYKPSSRFVESLCIWLNQFENVDRALAVNFILNNLVFISPAEMQHLVNVAFPDIVSPVLYDQSEKLIHKFHLQNVALDHITELVKHQSLFLAMSDGAHVDIFRRFNKLEHDQVCVSYDLSDTKFNEITSKMEQRSNKIVEQTNLSSELLSPTFRNVFLLDDFSGSGISYLRREIDSGKPAWDGKIVKVLNRLFEENIISNASDKDNPTIHIILYLITERALTALKKNISDYCKDNGVIIKIHFIQMIEPVHLTEDEEKWLRLYYKPGDVEDSHYKKGNMDNPHHGFDGCSLALVLYHNTPNNSFPILWAGENALFPRVTRHKDVRG